MLDMNNVEIKTGDVVEISGAYFKNDNGLISWNALPVIRDGLDPIIACGKSPKPES